MVHLRRSLLAFLAAVLILAVPVTAQTMRLTDDAYTSPQNGSTNYGTAPSLIVTGSGVLTNSVYNGNNNQAFSSLRSLHAASRHLGF